MKLTSKIIIFALLVNTLYAGEPSKTTACPAVTENAQVLLSSIEVLKGQVNEQFPECKSIVEKLEKVSGTFSNELWIDVRDQLKGESSVSLEAENVEALSALTMDVSSTLTEIVSSFGSNANACVDKADQPSFLSSLSGVIREVSGVIGGVGGPYGMAINLGGQLVASAISGVDQILEDKRNYNFNKKEHRKLFENQYCSFTDMQKDINEYLSLDTRLEEIKELDMYLDVKLADLKENCEYCKAYDDAFEARKDADKYIARIKEVSNLIEIESTDSLKSFSRCQAIHHTFHAEDSSFKLLMAHLNSYQNPMATRADMEIVTRASEIGVVLPEKFPSYESCILLGTQEKLELSIDFNMTMRDDILPIRDNIFTSQLSSFASKANKVFKSKLGDYTAKTLDRQNWLKAEKANVTSLYNDPNYTSSTKKIREEKRDLEHRILNTLMPRYLKKLSALNKKEIKKILKDKNRLTRLIRKGKITKDNHDPLYVSYHSRLQDQLKLALDQTQTFKRYCDHLKYMRNINLKSNPICSKNTEQIKELYVEIEEINEEIRAYMSKRDVFKNSIEGSYQVSKVQEYADLIKAWTDRGDARWEKK